MGIDPKTFEVFSVLSIPPVRDPQISDDAYANPADPSVMREKMRIVLRIAASKGHTRLILPAFGCGRGNHPPELVAKAWSEVLREKEFKGGWWEYVMFAVKGNTGAFE